MSELVRWPISQFLRSTPCSCQARFDTGWSRPSTRRPGNSTPAATVICLPPDPGSRPYLPGLFAIAALLALLILLPGRSGLRRAGVGAAAVLMAAVGVLATIVLAVSPLPEFRTSPPRAGSAAQRPAARYQTRALVRAGAARLGRRFLVAILAGVLRQPLGWTVLATLLPVAAIVWRQRRSVEALMPASPPSSIEAVLRRRGMPAAFCRGFLRSVAIAPGALPPSGRVHRSRGGRSRIAGARRGSSRGERARTVSITLNGGLGTTMGMRLRRRSSMPPRA